MQQEGVPSSTKRWYSCVPKVREGLAKFREAKSSSSRSRSGNEYRYLPDAARSSLGSGVVFEKAASIDPDNPAAHAMICKSRNESGDRSQHRQSRRAVRLSNGAAEYKAQLGKMLLLDDRSYEAQILNSISQTADSPLVVLRASSRYVSAGGAERTSCRRIRTITQRWPNIALTWYRLFLCLRIS